MNSATDYGEAANAGTVVAQVAFFPKDQWLCTSYLNKKQLQRGGLNTQVLFNIILAKNVYTREGGR